MRGLAANVLPPPTHIGLLIVPARALPVPFSRQGFAPPPEASDQLFYAFVPARPPDKKAVIT